MRLEMTKLNKVGTVSTTVSNDGVYTIVTYHSTQIVKFNEKEIILNTGGWSTSTTKNRMNQASNQFNLGYQVWQEKGEWFVQWKNGLTQMWLNTNSLSFDRTK